MMQLSRGSWIKFIFSLLITFGICIPLVQIVDLDNLIKVLATVSPFWISISVCSFACFQWLRTERYYLLVSPEGGKGLLFVTISAHTFLNNILPVGLGEGAFVYLLKKINGVPFLNGTSSLIFARTIDYTILCALFLIVLFWLRNRFEEALLWGLTTIEIIMAAVLLLLWLVILFRKRILAKMSDKLSRMGYYIKEFDKACHQLIKRNCMWRVTIYSVGMWLAMYSFFLSVIQALGFGLHAEDVLFLYIVIFPISLLPVRGLANFGTHEAAWIAALLAIDMEFDKAAMLAFGSHMVFLLVFIIFGLIPPAFLGVSRWIGKM